MSHEAAVRWPSPLTSSGPDGPDGPDAWLSDESRLPARGAARGRPRPDRGPRRRLPPRRGPAAAAAAPGGGLRPRPAGPARGHGDRRGPRRTTPSSASGSRPRPARGRRTTCAPRPRATASRRRWPPSPGWSARRAGRRCSPTPSTGSGTGPPRVGTSAEVERLARRLADAEQALRDVRARHREQVEEYKTENASLRRKLGESRAAHRAEREQAEEAVRQAQEAHGVAETLAAGQEKEIRRLRGQVAQWEARSEAQRPRTGGPRGRSATR